MSTQKEWTVEYSADKKKPWGVFVHANGNDIYQTAFSTKSEAEQNIIKMEMQQAEPLGVHNAVDDCECDCVMEASIDSFPCSDPPSWTCIKAH